MTRLPREFWIVMAILAVGLAAGKLDGFPAWFTSMIAFWVVFTISVYQWKTPHKK